MKISIPAAATLHEYLLSMGEGWVCKTYEISGDDIDKILYGGALPTKERQKKKYLKNIESDLGRERILKNFLNDHFIWDKPNVKHLRCQNAVDEPKPEITDEFLKEWHKMYSGFMEWDMKMNDNCMKLHGWSLGERVINKTTSLTTDDDIHERMFRYLKRGFLLSESYTKQKVVSDSKQGKNGHNLPDENFLDFMENDDNNAKYKAISSLRDDSVEY